MLALKGTNHGAPTLAILSPFLILLCAVGFYAYHGMSLPGDAMPDNGYIARGLGIVFSLVIGCGLMALVFYSHRHGYDEPPHYRGDR